MKRSWPFHVDSFSGMAAKLPPSRRTRSDVLAVLSQSGRVSTFDMGECAWLRRAIFALFDLGYIETKDTAYPWHHYVLTDAGRAALLQPDAPSLSETTRGKETL